MHHTSKRPVHLRFHQQLMLISSSGQPHCMYVSAFSPQSLYAAAEFKWALILNPQQRNYICLYNETYVLTRIGAYMYVHVCMIAWE